jgi:transposase
VDIFSAQRQAPVWVAVDVAKASHEALIELPDGSRQRLRIANTAADFKRFAGVLSSFSPHCEVALEPTGDYHRPLANFLLREGHRVHFVSSIATSRTREALYNSWDKNDPKDAQVILHLLKGGTTQTFSDPLENGYHDLQEMLGTYRQVVNRKTRLYHSLMTHYLPLYFPEAEPFLASSRSEWFLDAFRFAPCPAAVLQFTKAVFLRKTVKSAGHPTVRRRLVSEYYEMAKESVGLPVEPDSLSVRMFQAVLDEYIALAKCRRKLEKQIHEQLEEAPDYQRLRSIPGIGPIVALTVLAEAGDLRRFSHYRKFLNYCGFSLSTSQSGSKRGTPQLSKRGNARLRCAFWMAGKAAIAQRRNGFRRKYDDYVRSNPLDADLKRKAYTAVAAKMARVAYGLIKSGTDYRHFIEAAVPARESLRQGPLRQH